MIKKSKNLSALTAGAAVIVHLAGLYLFVDGANSETVVKLIRNLNKASGFQSALKTMLDGAVLMGIGIGVLIGAILMLNVRPRKSNIPAYRKTLSLENSN